MAKERIIWVDALKGWLIILVIFGHSVGGEGTVVSHINRMATSFLMPAFMAVSGWLFYQRNSPVSSSMSHNGRSYISSVVRRGYQLIIPYIIWSILVYLLRGNYDIDSLLDIAYKPDRYFWFLWVLFFIAVIFNGVPTLSRKLNINEMVLILSCCVALFVIMVVIELRIFGFQFLAYYFIFYTIGYCLHKYEDKLTYLHHPAILFVLFCFWLILAWDWQMHALPEWMPSIPYLPSSLLQYVYRGITAFFAVLILLTTAPYIINSKSKFNRLICLIGDVSLGLYVAHMTIMGYIQDRIHSMSTNIYVNIVSIFTLTFILSLLLVLNTSVIF